MKAKRRQEAEGRRQRAREVVGFWFLVVRRRQVAEG
jgi:hypothetical protein